MAKFVSRLFGPAAGALVVGTVGPLVLVSATTRPDQLGSLFVAFLGGWLVSRVGDPVPRLGPHPLTPTVAFVPVLSAFFVQMLSWAGLVSVHWNDLFGFLGIGVLGGALLTTEIQRRYLESTIDRETPRVTWTGPPAPGCRKRRIALAIALFSVLTSYGTAWLARLDTPLFSPSFTAFLFVFLAGLGTLALVSLIPTDHAIYDDGLLVDASDTSQGQFILADRLTGYSLSEDALIIHRPEPWLPAVRFDLEAIDDPASVTEELEAVGLPEI